MIYFICGVIGSAIIAVVVLPLFRKDDTLESTIIEETEWDLLQRKKEVLLGNIQDLDFEYKCGKLSEDDYHQVRSQLSADAASVLQRIDDIESSQDLDALIRREVGARRKKSAVANEVACVACNAKNPPSNKFCADCGAKLKG